MGGGLIDREFLHNFRDAAVNLTGEEGLEFRMGRFRLGSKCGHLKVGKNEKTGHHHPSQRTDRVEGLSQVEAASGRFGRSHRKNIGIGTRFQKGEPEG